MKRLKRYKRFCFPRTFNSEDLQNVVYIILRAATAIIMHINHLHLFVPMLIKSSETQSNFNNFIKKSFNLALESWTTVRRVIDIQLENHLEIGSAHQINSTKNLIAAH